MSEPDIDEFEKFIDLLLDSAPEGYEPWLFRCEKQGKAPATEFGSWKSEKNQLTPDEAVAAMRDGFNIGIAGMLADRLVNVDIDDEDETDVGDMKPTLMARSRSRTGRHAWYFAEEGEEVPNITTDEKGEVRAQGQYVLAPGSYVPTDVENVPESERDKAGFYTVENETTPVPLTKDELPEVFLAKLRETQAQQRLEETTAEETAEVPDIDGKSALYNVTAEDVAAREGASTDPSDRWESAFHGSTTGHNMSLSQKGRIQCWRHSVAHGGLQALVALSDHPGTCDQIGTGHQHSNAGPSSIKGDDSAIWHAWKYAKQHGYIPDDDPVPYRALKHLCRDRELCPASEIPETYDPENGNTLPDYAYDAAIETIEAHDELNAGRDKTDEIPTQSTDGGTQAARSVPDDGPSIEDDADDVTLTPTKVIERAGYEPGDVQLADLRNDEIAYTVAEMIDACDEEHFRWVNDDTTALYAYENGVWSANADNRLREVLHRTLRHRNSQRMASETEHAIKSRPTLKINRQRLGAPDGTVAVANGLLDLRDKTVRELQPDDMALNRINVAFEPDAEYEDTLWLEFLNEAVRDGDLRKLQEYAGYTLWQHAQPFGKALFLIGPTDAGKGVFLDVIEEILGEDNVASQSLYNLMQNRFGTANLFGKMANIRNEVTAGGLKNVESFKEITGGGDRISAERKGQDPFKFQVTQKFLFSTNQVPSIEHADEAFFNRLLFVKFPDTVPEDEQNPTLADEMLEDAPAILNWMLEGLDRLLTNQQFSGEKDIDEKRDVIDAWGNLADRFKHNLLEVTGNPEHLVHKADLFDLFNDYGDYLDKPNDMAQATFTKEMKGYPDISDGKSRKVDGDDDKPRVFKGVKIIDEGVEEIGADMPRHNYDSDTEPKQDRL